MVSGVMFPIYCAIAMYLCKKHNKIKKEYEALREELPDLEFEDNRLIDFAKEF